MSRVRDAVKFGASRVCPMCNSGLVNSSAVCACGRRANWLKSKHRTPAAAVFTAT